MPNGAPQERARRLLAGVTRRAGWVVAVTLGLALLALTRLVDLETGAPRLLLDPSADSMLPARDEARQFYDRARKLFGSDENLLVALSSGDAFAPESLRRIERLDARITAVEGVQRVDSLADALPEGGVPEEPGAIEAFREQVLASPAQAGTLVSGDGRTAALLVRLEDVSEQEFQERGTDLEIEAIAEEERGDAEVWITGNARIKAETTRFLLRDLTRIVPAAVLVMAAVAFVFLRTFRGVFVPLSTIAIGAIVTLALMAETIESLNQVTVAVPPILIVVGFAYAVHVMTAWYEELHKGFTGRQAARVALEHVALPVALTGITTAAGFLSLATSPLSAIRQFGVFTGLGVAIITIVSLTWAPALLALLPTPSKLRTRGETPRFDRLAERLAAFDLRHRVRILWAGAVVGFAALLAMGRIEVGTDLVQNFAPDTSVRRDFEAVNAAFGGANAFYIVLEAGYRDAFTVPENLQALAALEKRLDDHAEIGGTTSIVDALEHAATAGKDTSDGASWLPATRERAAALLDALPEDDVSRFLDPRRQVANIVVRTTAIDSADVVRLVDAVEADLATVPPNLVPTVTGNTVLLSKTVDAIALGQALSLGTAFLIIYAILALLFTSLRVGLLALIPNALPVLVYFGVLGLSGVTLNTTTGLVASLVLGIAVDDTIHYMARFHTEAKRRADERKGVIEALRTVGRPVTYTTVALCLGFLTLTLSSLQNQVQFGALAAFTLAFAWLVDVTFTPALAARMRVVTLWEVLTLDLGPQPQRAIPLFAGMNRAQARIVALMADVLHVHRGHHMLEAGATSDAMYVVIDGELEVSVKRDDGVVTLATVKRGDTVGEASLFHGRRIADVHAVSDARLLRLTHADLEDLRHRYPRTAGVLYHNLTRILSGRLARTTELVG